MIKLIRNYEYDYSEGDIIYVLSRDGEHKECPLCEGTKYLVDARHNGIPIPPIKCPLCYGTGKVKTWTLSTDYVRKITMYTWDDGSKSISDIYLGNHAYAPELCFHLKEKTEKQLEILNNYKDPLFN